MLHRKLLYAIFVYFTLLLLVISLVFTALGKGTPIRQELNRDPGESYNTDMRGFLKTYYLMKDGVNFYQAFPVGMRGAFHDNFEVDLAGWREPLIFYLWKLLPGKGESIYYLALAMFSLNLVLAYLIARSFLPPLTALLSPLLLIPYFQLPLTDLTILQIEWWALSLFLVGLTFYLYNYPLAAGIFFALTLASREMFFAPIVALALLRPSARLIIPLGIFAVYYVFHLTNIWAYKESFFRPLKLGDWRFLHKAFAYASWNYPFGTYRPFLVSFFLTTATLLLQALRHKAGSLILLATYLPTFALLVTAALIGRMTQWHDYWGIYFVPLLIIVTPIALTTFLQTLSQE